MCGRLLEGIIESTITDITTADTFANKEILSSRFDHEIYNYLTIERKQPEEKEKIIITRSDEEATVSIKGYNFIFNLNSLWKQLPENIGDIITFLHSNDIMTDIVAILNLIRRVSKLFHITLSKKHEAVCIVIAHLSRGEYPTSFDQIYSTCETLRRNNARFPLFEEGELQKILAELVTLKCICEKTEKKYTSSEKVVL